MSRVWDLAGRAIVITGGSSGIGAATAVACARAGMDVAVGGRREEGLEHTVRQVQAGGGRGLAVRCDVTSDADVQQLVDRAYERFGRLDAVFCNAGLGLVQSVLETTDEQMRYLFEVNYYGTLRTARAAVPLIRQTAAERPHPHPHPHSGDATADRMPKASAIRGQVVICSSVVSEIALPYYGAYGATKAAGDAIGSAMRAELASEGIWVSSVHPIGTRTEFFEKSGDPQGRHTHRWFMQSAQKVAAAVVRGLRRPKAEIWPHWPTRFGVASCTAMPGMAAWVLRRMAKRQSSGNREGEIV